LTIKYNFLINPTDAPVKGKRTFDDLVLVYRSLSWTVVTFFNVSSVFSTKDWFLRCRYSSKEWHFLVWNVDFLWLSEKIPTECSRHHG